MGDADSGILFDDGLYSACSAVGVIDCSARMWPRPHFLGIAGSQLVDNHDESQGPVAVEDHINGTLKIRIGGISL